MFMHVKYICCDHPNCKFMLLHSIKDEEITDHREIYPSLKLYIVLKFNVHAIIIQKSLQITSYFPISGLFPARFQISSVFVDGISERRLTEASSATCCCCCITIDWFSRQTEEGTACGTVSNRTHFLSLE